MTTRAQELMGVALYLDGIVGRCRVRRVLGSCAICAGDAHAARDLARAALLSTLRKQWLRLEYCPRPPSRTTLSKTS